MGRAKWLMWSAFLSLAGCGPREHSEDGHTVPVRVEPVTQRDLARTVVYAADLEPWSTVRVYSRIADRIVSLSVRDGDSVQKGQRLALVRRDALDKGLEQMSAQIEALDIQIRTQTEDLQRSRELLAGGVITQQVFDQASAGLAASEAQRRALKASLDQLSINAGDAAVVAPISGVVAHLDLSLGDQASPASPFCSVLAVDPLKVDLDMSETDAMQVEVGEPVRIRVQSLPDEVFEGRVTRVYPYLEDTTRTNTVEVRLPNPADPSGVHKLKPGMFGRAEITVDRRTQVVVAPEQALVMDPVLLARARPGQDLRKAFVVDGEGRAQEREVELGIRSGSLREVTSGLEVGERLVVRGQYGVADGQAVQVLEATP
ncbi:MAG: efflux RND transporter periplasmic adaptor subunit [Deltaproteobacteria bacterium]|nr:efflux RND transporter periplasmic adaptor subunit [Deltaproteobacteria bacterium]